jgi:hypothetical protein
LILHYLTALNLSLVICIHLQTSSIISKMHFTAILFAATASVQMVTAVCPGYNYVFGKIGAFWTVLDDGCHPRYTCNYDNPCTCPSLGCSPSPAHVDRVMVDGLWYKCRGDPNSGSCSDSKMESCVSVRTHCASCT